MRSLLRQIPNFSLYGEQSGDGGRTDSLHIEDIPSRSRKYLWRIGTHRHTALSQCVFVATGPVAVDLEESHDEVEGPALIIVPAGSVHGFGFRADIQGYVLTVDLDRLTSAASAAHQNAIAGLFSAARVIPLAKERALSARAGQLLAALLHEFRQPDSLMAPVSGWLACSVLWVFASTLLPIPSSGAMARQDLDRMRRFRLLIESHYLRHWPVERYAGQMALSGSSLNRLCRNLTGRTAFDIIQQRLALEARRRLMYVGNSVAATAAELGFTDPAYFCRFFRKHNGTSPSAFRRRHGGR
jgi:AraC family transcriptional activator of pobA